MYSGAKGSTTTFGNGTTFGSLGSTIPASRRLRFVTSDAILGPPSGSGSGSAFSGFAVGAVVGAVVGSFLEGSGGGIFVTCGCGCGWTWDFATVV
jgi:hypothetical protein